MTATVANFIRSAVVYMIIGVTMGALMAIYPQWGMVLRTSHAHINLLGWVSMMIFGVGYHTLPRFIGKPLHSEKIALVQLILANVGVVGFAVFSELFNTNGGDLLRALLGVSGAIEALAFYLFAYNMLRTM